MKISELVGVIWFLLWAGATVLAFLFALQRIIQVRGSARRRWILGLLCLGAWLALQFVAFVLSFALGYCENCSDKPVRPADYLAVAVFSAPTALAWLLLLLTRKRHS